MSFFAENFDTKATRTLNSCDNADHAICCFKNWALLDVGFNECGDGKAQGGAWLPPVSQQVRQEALPQH